MLGRDVWRDTGALRAVGASDAQTIFDDGEPGMDSDSLGTEVDGMEIVDCRCSSRLQSRCRLQFKHASVVSGERTLDASLFAPQGTVAERPQRPHRQDHHALNIGPCGRLLSLTARVHCPAAVSEVSKEVSSTSKLMLPSLVPASSFIASASSELREYR